MGLLLVDILILVLILLLILFIIVLLLFLILILLISILSLLIWVVCILCTLELLGILSTSEMLRCIVIAIYIAHLHLFGNSHLQYVLSSCLLHLLLFSLHQHFLPFQHFLSRSLLSIVVSLIHRFMWLTILFLKLFMSLCYFYRNLLVSLHHSIVFYEIQHGFLNKRKLKDLPNWRPIHLTFSHQLFYQLLQIIRIGWRNLRNLIFHYLKHQVQ